VFVIGDVLGAGIYALVGEVAGRVGGAVWTSFLLAGVLAAFTAVAYAGGLLALGVVLWAISRAFTGPPEPIDPVKLVD
jgi:Kef-type K+ transport system membrane component KefB